MPIQGLPSSNQQEAFGASGGIISTGFEKKLNQDKIAAEIAAGTTPFQNVLVNMVNTKDNVAEVEQKEVGIELESTSNYTKVLERIAQHHTASIRKKIREKKPDIPIPEEEIIIPEKELTPEEKARRIEETFLKDYIALAAKWIVGRPQGEMDAVRAMIGAVKKELMGMGLTAQEFKYIDQKTLDMIKEAFLHLIKDKFLSSLNRPLELVELILQSTKSQAIVDFLTSFEKDSLVVARYAKEFDIKDLSAIAVSLRINIDEWMKELKIEKIKIENLEQIDKLNISFRFEEKDEVSGISSLITTYRNTQINIFMSDSLIEKIKINFESIRISSELKANGLSDGEISELKIQSRRIAWLRTISTLKMSHLSRIMVTSAKEFNEKSTEIEKLTKKSQKLGYDIPKEGITWLRQSLHVLAVEAAQYKLDLLKSLQKISIEKEREKDILQLTRTLAKLKKTK